MSNAPSGFMRGQSFQAPTRLPTKSWPTLRRQPRGVGCTSRKQAFGARQANGAAVHARDASNAVPGHIASEGQLRDDPTAAAGLAEQSGSAAAMPAGQSDGLAPSASGPSPLSRPQPLRPRPADQPPWLSRAACLAIAAATTLGVLAGSAFADLAIGPAAAAAAGGAWRDTAGSAAASVATTLPYEQYPRRLTALSLAQHTAEPGVVLSGGTGLLRGTATISGGSESGSGSGGAYRAVLAGPDLAADGMAFPLDGNWVLGRLQPGVAAAANREPAGPDSGGRASGRLWAVRTTSGSASGPWSGRPASGGSASMPVPVPGSSGAALLAAPASEAGGDGSSLVPELVSGELASETEDRLLEAARQVEARVEGVLGALTSGVPQLLAGPESAEDLARSTVTAHTLIQEVWEVVDSNYLDARATGFNRQRWAELRDAALAVPYRDTASAYRAVRDLMARGLSDPYCRFIGPQELEAMKKYDVSGVGLNLGTAAEYVIKTGNDLPAQRDPAAGEGVYVVGVSKGSTADVAGIRQGDELLAIQGESLESSTPFRAAGLISGAAQQQAQQEAAQAGSETGAADGQSQAQVQSSRAKGGSQSSDVVVVQVRHPSGAEEELSLVRPRRTVPSVVTTSLTRSAVQLPGGGRGEEVVGTVRLSAFNARAQADVASAIRRLEASGATRLVLDLRDNRGGLVTEGLEVARLFLEDDAPIVITERRDAAPDTPTAPGPPLTSSPLLVLVNGHTASASEIVAGALRDNCRAVLAGSRTYGKGLIQSVYELSDGSGLVITVGKYLTPRGNDIDRYGIKPDYSSVPSNAQYDSTVKACKLSAPEAVRAPALVAAE